jgi:hypothetical protein
MEIGKMKKYSLHDERKMQLDVIEIADKHVLCNFYMGVHCSKILMSRYDYDELVRKKVFIRDGKEKDSADVWNTTDEYRLPLAGVID